MCRPAVWGLFASILIASAARAEISTTRPMPAVTLERDVQTHPPLKFFVVTVNLSDPRVHLKVSRGSNDARLPAPWETTLMPVSGMAKRDGLSVAVNGNLFHAQDGLWIFGREMPYTPGNLARCCGWAMSDGLLYSATPMDRNWPSLVVNDLGKVSIGRFIQLPADARQVVSGVAQIVTDGRNSAAAEHTRGELGRPTPCTAAGIDQAGSTLILLVADGRRPNYSVGITNHHLAQEMLRRGAWNALALDGGGSSTLVVRDARGTPRVINYPSDGHQIGDDWSVERSVANALGVVIDGSTTQPAQKSSSPSDPR
jgi:Phosphodiester glycosidase